MAIEHTADGRAPSSLAPPQKPDARGRAQDAGPAPAPPGTESPSPERIGANLRCGQLPWLDECPATPAGCLALVVGQPAARCSHTHFIYADLGDRNCACAPPRPANCDGPGSKDVIGAVVASLYRAGDVDSGRGPPGGGVAEASRVAAPGSRTAIRSPPEEATGWTWDVDWGEAVHGARCGNEPLPWLGRHRGPETCAETVLSRPPSENCSTAIFNFAGHDGNCRCVSTGADCVRGAGLDVRVHRPNVMGAESTLCLIRHGPGSSFPAGGAEVRLATSRAKANAEAASLVALTDRLVSARTLEPWEAASISISDGSSWSVPTRLKAGDGRTKPPGWAVLGTCDPPEGTPRHCCFGSGHNGGGPSWSAGDCDARTNGLLHRAATGATGSRQESMPEIISLLAVRGMSLAMTGDSVGDQFYIGAECDWRRHDGSCTTEVHPPRA